MTEGGATVNESQTSTVCVNRGVGTGTFRYPRDGMVKRNPADQRTEGVLAYWRGVGPRLGRVVPGQGIIFMSFEAIQRQIEALIA